jgi:orotate phosphoribosyltransferase
VRGGRLLLVKSPRGYWSAPGGHLDFGESPAACAARETLEETGVRVTNVRFVAITNDVLTDVGKHYVTIWMRGDPGSDEAVIGDASEIAQVGWFAPDELPGPLFPYFRNLIGGHCHPSPPLEWPWPWPSRERRDLAVAIRRASHLEGEFRLRSGASAQRYFDKYQFEGDPRLLRAVAEALVGLVPPDAQMLGGLELGGVPIATILGQLMNVPVVFVRKAAKEYGTCRLAEGGSVAGRRLVVVEDVVTSGGQIIESVRELRALGAQVDTALCVIDREAGGVQALASQGVALRALFRMSELDEAAV